MAITSHGIPLADESTIVNPIQTPLNAIANALDLAITDVYNSLDEGLGVSGRLIGTNAERLALTAPRRRKGILFYCDDTNKEWRYNGTAWVDIDTGWVAAPALSSGWSAQSPDTLAYRVKDGMLFLSGRLNATGAAGATPFSAALPVGARPDRTMTVLVGSTGGSGAMFSVVLDTAGVLTVFHGSDVVNHLPLSSIPPMSVPT